MIAAYEAEDKAEEFFSPRQYGIAQQHKHLPEMRKVCGLTRTPLFSPIVDDYYSGMLVTVPLHADLMQKKMGVASLREYYADFYAGSLFVSVAPEEDAHQASGFLAGNTLSGKDSMRIYVTGNDERILVASQFDNLGKGASGAAMQCMNLVMGCEETKGLFL